MQNVVDAGELGGASFCLHHPRHDRAPAALSGAVNSGMTLLEEKIRAFSKYFVAPIPRMSVLFASTASGMVKTLIKSLIILVIALIFGARLQTGPRYN